MSSTADPSAPLLSNIEQRMRLKELRKTRRRLANQAKGKLSLDRLLFLDVLRGFTVFGMIIVNSPGDKAETLPTLLHADWFGWTLADTVFPAFLFAMGLSLQLSFHRIRRRSASTPASFFLSKILYRTFMLLFLGLALNTFAAINTHVADGGPLLDWATLRLPGVLQRIAACYAVVATVLVVAPSSHTTNALVAIVALSAYSAIMLGYAVPECDDARGELSPECNAASYIDRAVLGSAHMYRQGLYDPEGLVSTLPAIVSVLAGVTMGKFVLDSKDHVPRLGSSLVLGVAAGGIGLCLAWCGVPMSKKLWTPSYTLWTAGINLLGGGALYYLLEVLAAEPPGYAEPFRWLGVNSLAIYIGSVMLKAVLRFVAVSDTLDLWTWTYQYFFASWIMVPIASFVMALLYTCFWIVVGYYFDKWGVYIKL